MKRYQALLLGAAALPACLYATETVDTIPADTVHRLGEIIVTAQRPVIRQEADRIVYMPAKDPYARGLDGIAVLDRMPRVSVENDAVSVAGKTSVRYIIDGHLLETTDAGVTMRLKNLTASGIEKVELLTLPPSK